MKKLGKIILPKSLESLDHINGFYNCSKLSKIIVEGDSDDTIFHLPEKITKISGTGFNKTSITELNIGKNIKTIVIDSIKETKKLESINVEEDNEFYSSIDGALFAKDKKELLYYPTNKKNKEYRIPNTTLKINKNAFLECNHLKKINLENVRFIGEYAFNNCPNITEIKNPNNVLLNDNSFDKGIMDRIQKNSKEMENKIEKYDLNRLINETNNLSIEEKENYIKNLLKEHKLDNLDLSSISKMNHIGFNKETNELTWKCFKHGYCSCDIWDLLKDNKKMIENFEYNGCGYCE